MPSTLPAPASGVTGASDEKVRYVVAAQSGHAAHPDNIVASCQALRAHVTRMQEESERMLRDFEDYIRDRDLAEKRRVAPGWLDSDARLLQPERRPGSATAADAEVTGRFAEMRITGDESGVISEMAVDQGEELDRAFGGR
ncbi:hypothetical protein AAE478_004553 [Parahypoxylon ruwenzoriense]